MKKVKGGLRANPNSPDRLVAVDRTTDGGEVAENETHFLDEERIGEEKEFHGYYAIATNILKSEMDALDVIAVNAGRWKVERCFRDMKCTVETGPIYLRNGNSVKVHLFLGTVAVFVLMSMSARIRERTAAGATPVQIQEALQGM